MRKKSIWLVISLVLISAIVFTACQSQPEVVNGVQIPEAKDDKFNVAVVMLSNHDDGGWSQAQWEGINYVQDNMDGVHTAYVELVAEGADSEQVFRALARKGFDLIIGGSFGYMDPMQVVAEEFPDIGFVHISGYKFDGVNFGNLFGEMEVMKYVAGMIAGSRAKADGATRVGGMATFPIPEELRLFNAYALGVAETCPDCDVDIRWIFTWHDPIVEREGADSLFDAGSHVVMTGADTPASALAAADREGVYGITYDWIGSCTIDECLTAPYWVWGPEFVRIAEEVQAGTYPYMADYFGAAGGGVALYGFMDGQELQPGVASLPADDLAAIQAVMDSVAAGEFDRFDVFAGPIVDIDGNVVVPDGEFMTQADIDQFAPGAPGFEATYGMYWWNQNIAADLPDL